MSIPLTVRRLLLVFAIAATGVALGLSTSDWIDLRLVDPSLHTDSESVLARGFPHAWWVVHPQPSVPSPTPKRIATRNLLQSAFFWLACSAVAVAAGIAAARTWKRASGRLSGDTIAVRAFAALATALCAAGYARLFIGMVGFWPLAAATCFALLPPLLFLRSRADLRKRWRGMVLGMVGIL